MFTREHRETLARRRREAIGETMPTPTTDDAIEQMRALFETLHTLNRTDFHAVENLCGAMEHHISMLRRQRHEDLDPATAPEHRRMMAGLREWIATHQP